LDWSLDSQGKIQDIGFRGIINTLRDLQLELKYKGKQANLELGWVLSKEGFFDIYLDQSRDLTIDFGQFAPQSDVYDLEGTITLANPIDFDVSWKWEQGTGNGNGAIDPGYFTVNKHTSTPNIRSFNFLFTYNDKYGVDVSFSNLQFYLDLEWWKGDRLLPYIWLDYYVVTESFDVHLLWTNLNGETQWYYNIEDWI
jgi:hypothetical protein